MHNPNSFYRLPETQARYEEYKKTVIPGTCVLCEKPTKQAFTHWRIVENSYPYDRIAIVHDLILPVAHKTESELTPAAWQEFNELKHGVISDSYQYLLEPTLKNKSAPTHFHVHLLIGN